MSTPDSPGNKNIYFLDSESAAEMARLLDMDRAITEGMGGLLPEVPDFAGIRSVLDVACGPGGWAQEIAFAHPDIEVVGFDIGETMIKYANAQAAIQGLDNLTFHVMDMQEPLDFLDQSFDLTNARSINFLPVDAWPRLVGEMARVTRPNGIVRLTESEWWYFTNSPALERLNSVIIRSIKARGSYSESGLFTGVLPMLGRLLMDAGCQDVQYTPHVIDFSYGAKAHEAFRRSNQVTFKLFQPQMVQLGIAKQEDLERDYEQMVIDMMREDFRGLMFILTAWGRRK